MPIGNVWIIFISFTVCLFVRLRISSQRIKLAASHFARRFIGVQRRKYKIFVNFAHQKPKIGRNGQRAGHAHPRLNIAAEMRRCKRHAIEMHRSWNLSTFAIYRAACGRRIGMCGYTSVPFTDLLVQFFIILNVFGPQIFGADRCHRRSPTSV